MRPKRPSSTARRTCLTATLKRFWWQADTFTPRSSARRTISSASAIDIATGFSITALTLASMQSSAMRACSPLSVATAAMSRSGSAASISRWSA